MWCMNKLKVLLKLLACNFTNRSCSLNLHLYSNNVTTSTVAQNSNIPLRDTSAHGNIGCDKGNKTKQNKIYHSHFRVVLLIHYYIPS